MATPTYNYFQQYEFSEEDMKAIKAHLGDPLIQQFLQDKLATINLEANGLDYNSDDLPATLAERQGAGDAILDLIHIGLGT